MNNPDYIEKEKLERAFGQIRKDIAALHRDLGYSELNRTRWIFVLMWLVSADLLQNLFNIGPLYSLGISGVIVVTYRRCEGLRIARMASRVLKEPLEPTWDTKIDLS